MPLTDIAKLNVLLGETDITTAKIQAIKWACGLIEEYCGREFEQGTRSEWLTVSHKGTALLSSYPVTPGSNVIVRQSTSAVQITLTTGYGAIVSSIDRRYRRDALTLENNGVVVNLEYSDYSNLSALVTAINATTGWTATVCGDYSYTHLKPVSIPVVGGIPVVLEGPGQLLSGYRIDNNSGVITGLNYLSGSEIYVSYTAGLDIIPPALEMIATQMSAAALRLKPENPGMRSESYGDYSYTKAESDDLLMPYMKILSQFRRPLL